MPAFFVLLVCKNKTVQCQRIATHTRNPNFDCGSEGEEKRREREYHVFWIEGAAEVEEVNEWKAADTETLILISEIYIEPNWVWVGYRSILFLLIEARYEVTRFCSIQ